MKKRFPSLLLALCMALTLLPTAALAVGAEYSDNHGHTVTVPDGAFAARILFFTAGDPWTSEAEGQVQEHLLGAPDENPGSLCLGYGGSVVLEFDVNIYDGEGDDIHIFEDGGSSMENVRVAVSSDLNTWYDLGTVGGKTASVDLDGKVPGGSSFRYVCLVDGKSSTSGWPGADINAVAGLNVRPLTVEQQSAGTPSFSSYPFVDRKDNLVIVPRNAFAARVVSFEAGTPWTADPTHMNPQTTVGKPDYQNSEIDGTIGALTLGCSGVLILEYDTSIYDGEGDDIYVFEVGPDAEATKVAVSSDLETWYDVGTAQGSTSGVDLNGKVPEGSHFRYVRLTDAKKTDGSRWPGADIDAVAGLNVKAIASQWAQSEMDRAEELDLIPDVLVNADLTQPITRMEFAAVSVKTYEALNGTKAIPSVVNPFTDCIDVEVLKAYNIGTIAGTSATTFSPNDQLNREQAAAMLTRVFKRCTLPGWTLATDSQFSLSYTMPAPFADDRDISGWARDSVYFMASNGIINGKPGNLFAPKNVTTAQEAEGYANATREQALAIAVRMVEKLG